MREPRRTRGRRQAGARRRSSASGRLFKQFPAEMRAAPSGPDRTLASPMTRGPWELAPCTHASARALAAALGIDDVTASVLVRRGYGAPDDARRFLAGALPGHDPL